MFLNSPSPLGFAGMFFFEKIPEMLRKWVVPCCYGFLEAPDWRRVRVFRYPAWAFRGPCAVQKYCGLESIMLFSLFFCCRNVLLLSSFAERCFADLFLCCDMLFTVLFVVLKCDVFPGVFN